ncbi:MAG: mercuric reductase [Vicinamibacterales bacterium]
MTVDPPDRALIEHVHPPGWVNPLAAESYDLVVIGGGTAGLVSAMGAAGLGARVALVERHRLGGDCLNTGCVPSKALLRSARAVGELRKAAAVGVLTGELVVDFESVMRRMRDRRASIAVNDSALRLERAGVHVFFGEARFLDRRTVGVGGQSLRFGRAVIATGGRAAAPPVPGLNDVPFLTNETVFDLTTLPRRLLIVGAGPIGCELAQAFARFGAAVTLLDQSPRVLPRESADAAALVERALGADGVRFELGVALVQVTRDDDGIRLHYRREESAPPALSVVGDGLLVAAGRRPNVEGLDLETAGVGVDANGIAVDDRLRTSNRRVYASGDVCSKFKFTHAAGALSRLVLQNALFFGRRRVSALVIPWVTYTDPEVAHVGVSEADVRGSHGRLSTITIQLSQLDRSVVDDETEGFVSLHHEGGRLRGCTIVAPHAGEIIGEAVYALTHGGSLADLSSTIHAYPTVAEALRKAGDAYRRQGLTASRRRWLTRYFEWTRRA